MNLWPVASEFRGPVLLVGADPDVERPSPTATTNKAMAEEGGFDYVAIPGTGHMLQLEEPEACVRAMEDFLARHGARRLRPRWARNRRLGGWNATASGSTPTPRCG